MSARTGSFIMATTALALVAAALPARAKCPSNYGVASRVRQSDAKAFASVKVVGKWTEQRQDTVAPLPPDECNIRVHAVGPKHSDGTWYEYTGLAIYRRNIYKQGVGPYHFDHFFPYEDMTTLKGFPTPPDQQLLELYEDTLRSKHPFIFGVNSSRVTHIYSIALSKDERFQASSRMRIAYNVTLVLDTLVSNTKLQKQRISVRASAIKKDKDSAWRGIFSRKVRDQKSVVLAERTFPSTVAKQLPRLRHVGLDAMFGPDDPYAALGVPSSQDLEDAAASVVPLATRSAQWFDRICGPQAAHYAYEVGKPVIEVDGRDFKLVDGKTFRARVQIPLSLRYVDRRAKGGPYMTGQYVQHVKLTFHRGTDGKYAVSNLTVPGRVNGMLADRSTAQSLPEAKWRALQVYDQRLPAK